MVKTSPGPVAGRCRRGDAERAEHRLRRRSPPARRPAPRRPPGCCAAPTRLAVALRQNSTSQPTSGPSTRLPSRVGDRPAHPHHRGGAPGRRPAARASARPAACRCHPRRQSSRAMTRARSVSGTATAVCCSDFAGIRNQSTPAVVQGGDHPVEVLPAYARPGWPRLVPARPPGLPGPDPQGRRLGGAHGRQPGRWRAELSGAPAGVVARGRSGEHPVLDRGEDAPPHIQGAVAGSAADARRRPSAGGPVGDRAPRRPPGPSLNGGSAGCVRTDVSSVIAGIRDLRGVSGGNSGRQPLGGCRDSADAVLRAGSMVEVGIAGEDFRWARVSRIWSR